MTQAKLMGIALVALALVAWAGSGGAQTGRSAPADSASFDGASPDTGLTLEQPPEPPGERWTLARAVAAALEGSVDARAAHARTVQARGSALSAWSGILPSLTGNLIYNHTIPDSRNSFYVVQVDSSTTASFLVKRQQQKIASAGVTTNLFSVPAWSEKRRQDLLSRSASASEAEARNGVVYAVKQQY